jgi:hypothetical protein
MPPSTIPVPCISAPSQQQPRRPRITLELRCEGPLLGKQPSCLQFANITNPRRGLFNISRLQSPPDSRALHARACGQPRQQGIVRTYSLPPPSVEPRSGVRCPQILRDLKGHQPVRFPRRAHGPPRFRARSCDHEQHPDGPMQHQMPWAPRRRLAKQTFLDSFRLNPHHGLTSFSPCLITSQLN